MNILDVFSWVNVWSKRLYNAIISNIYYKKNENDIILLKIKQPGENLLLIGEPGKRLHATWRVQPPTEYKPYPLVALARKHLRGDKLESITLVSDDRIIELAGRRGYKLVIELLPRGIAALLDPNNIVLAVTREFHGRDRIVRPKKPYTPPPPADTLLKTILRAPTQADPESLAGKLGSCMEKGKDTIRGLIRGCAVPGEVAEEALYRAGIDKKAKPSSLSNSDLKSLAENLIAIVGEALGDERGWLLIDENGAPLEANPFRPLRWIENSGNVEEYELFDEALDKLFTYTPATVASLEEGGEEDEELQRLQESLKRAEERVRELREKTGLLRKLAEAIAANYRGFELLFEKITGERPRSLELGRVKAWSLGDRYQVETPLGSFQYYPGESPDEVIVRLYREAGELEAKAERAENVKGEILARAEELKLKARARSLMRLARRRRRFWFERFHWTITRDGFLAIGGRDASQNEVVVKRYLSSEDIFLHANIHGAPAVVLKTRGRQPSEEDLYDAAVITAAYSRAWKAGAGSIEVYYAGAEQVSFSPPSGEYLAKGGIMVYGRKRYLPKPVPVRVAVGVALDNKGIPIVFAGSEETVSKRTIVYAILAPGEHGKEEAAEVLRREWARLLGRDEAYIAYAVPPEDIHPRLPGRSRVLRVRRGMDSGLELSKYA